jgi:hypothetical protein
MLSNLTAELAQEVFKKAINARVAAAVNGLRPRQDETQTKLLLPTKTKTSKRLLAFARPTNLNKRSETTWDLAAGGATHAGITLQWMAQARLKAEFT